MYDMIRTVQEMGPVGQPCICNRQITFSRNDFLHLKLQLLPNFQMLQLTILVGLTSLHIDHSLNVMYLGLGKGCIHKSWKALQLEF